MPLKYAPAVTTPTDFRERPDPGPSARETFGAAFALENDVANAYSAFTRQRFEPDIDYHPADDIDQSDLKDDYRDVLAQALSAEEFKSIETRIREELRLRDVMARSGWSGIVAGVAAGIISPTIFLPIAAAGRGTRATASAFGYAAVAAGTQEAVLYGAQETRTLGEVALGVTTATVLGGLLGSAAVYLRRGEFDRISSDMAASPGERTILEGAPIGSKGEAVAPGTGPTRAISALEEAGGDFRAARAAVQDDPIAVKVLQRAEERVAAQLSAEFDLPKLTKVQREEIQAVFEEQFGQKVVGGRLELTGDEARELAQALRERYAPEGGLEVTAPRRKSMLQLADKIENALPPKDVDRIAKLKDDAVKEAADQVEAEIPQAASAGAAAVETPVSGMKSAFWIGRQLAKISPVLRALNAERVPMARQLIRDLSDAGVRMADNVRGVATSVGGTIENNVKVWNGNLYKTLVRLDELYADYLGQTGRPTKARMTSHMMRTGLVQPQGRMTRQEFNREVTRAMWSDDKHEIAQVGQAAEFIRAQVYDPLGKAAASGPKPLIDPKFFEPDPLTGETRQVVGAKSYLNRIYDVIAIKANPVRFVNLLTEHRVKKMEAAFQKRMDKVTSQRERLLQEAEDLSLEEGEAQKLIEEIKAELEEFEKSALARDASDEIDYKKALARDLKESDPEQAKQLREDAKRMEDVQEIGDFRRRRGALRSRLRTLARSAGRVSERRREKLERIEKIEAEQLKGLERVVRAADRAAKGMAKVSDENLDAQARALLQRLKNEGRIFDRSQDKIVSLADEEIAAATRAKGEALPGEVKVKLSAAAAEEIERFFPEEFVALGLKKGTSVLPAHQVRELATKMEGLIAGLDRPPGRRKAFADAARKMQDSLGEFRDPDLSEAAAIAFRLDDLQMKAAARQDRMTELAEKLESVEIIDRPMARDFIQAVREDALRRVNDINSRKAVRSEKLRKEVGELDPAFVRKRAEELRGKADNILEDMVDGLRARGIVDVDLEKRTADFRGIAEEEAIIVRDKILGSPQTRLVGMDIIADARGPELARTLDIDNEVIQEFLETDIETNIRAYVRTMAPDVEIYKKWGDGNGAIKMAELKQRYRDEEVKVRERIDAGELSEDAGNKEIIAIKEESDKVQHILTALIQRLKHQRGLPADASGFGYRAGKVATDLNTLRLMGGVAISSIPDLARPVMKYGLLRTFRDGWAPMVRNFKNFQAIAREAHAAGTANDIHMAGRASAMFDILDDVGRFSMAERGINWASNRIGNVALFNHWTAWQKQITAGVANGKLWDELEVLATGKGNTKKAIEFLAESGIDESNWRKLWQQLQDGNVQRVDGTWLPNTEDWTDASAIQLYRQFIAKHSDDTIITPGLERPLLADESMTLRLIFQFRSFMLSSNTKMMIAGLQEPDRALLNGVLLSLTMGAFGYYTYAMVAGGDIKKAMLNAGPDKWADEAIARSGLMGVFADAQRVAERTPGLNHLATFSGERTTRRGGEDLIATILGPSYSLAKNGFGFITALEEPTESTLHKLRLITPYQNVWYLRSLLDQVEASTADALGLPESRR